MGQVSARPGLVVLRSEAQLVFKQAALGKDIAEMVTSWQEDGGTLGLTEEMCGTVVRVGGGGDSAQVAHEIFEMLDTDGNQKVDVLEVLCASIALASGALEEKLDMLFGIFDFSGTGRLNFDEVNILLASFCRGAAKVCGTPAETDEGLVQATRQAFDCHNVPYEKLLTKEQLKRWARHDVEAAMVLQMYHGATTMGEMDAVLARLEETQQAAFEAACLPGSTDVPMGAAGALRESLGAPPGDIWCGLLEAMSAPSGLQVHAELFCRVSRAWNGFRAVDVARKNAVPLEMVPLLWLLSQPDRKSAAASTDRAALDKLREVLPAEGDVPWHAWVTASTKLRITPPSRPAIAGDAEFMGDEPAG